jgi:hypothetical protein
MIGAFHHPYCAMDAQVRKCRMLSSSLSLRLARPEDDAALERLAALDCAPVPQAPVLVAFEDGEPRAARSLATGAVVADPFVPSAHLVELLSLRAVTLGAAPKRVTVPALRRLRLA